MVEEVGVVVNQGGDHEAVDLPPGFRFHPTDEEIITHYLKEKVFNVQFTAAAIGQVDLNKNEPWDLPKIAKMGEKEFYFFCQRDRKYPTGMRTNRATLSGYWKATGKDKEIFRGKGCIVGMKKTLVFYRGRAPKGEKTNWVMHEYRLDGKYSYQNLPRSARDEWVVCRVFHKNAPPINTTTTTSNQLIGSESLDNIDHLLDFSALPPLIDPGFLVQPGPSFSVAGQQNNLNPILHHSTTVAINSTYFPAKTVNYTYHSDPNCGSGFGYGTGSGNNNNGIKFERSLMSVSQETGLSSDMNTTTSPEICNEMSNDDDDLGIFWDDYKLI